MNSYPNMNSMSDVVALKRVDMETMQRERRKYPPVTSRLVPWNISSRRPSVYYPNINRSYLADLTYVPGSLAGRFSHTNSINRRSSWSPYTREQLRYFHENFPGPGEIETEGDEKEASLADVVHHPKLLISQPLGLLKREYKHPLSMYEESLNNMYSRYAQQQYALKERTAENYDPTLPQHYRKNSPFGVYWYLERTPQAGKEWVTNRWRMWSGGSASSLE